MTHNCNVQAQCERVSSTLSMTLVENIKSASYMLGNLYYFLSDKKLTSEERILIKRTLREAKPKLGRKEINDLWDSFISLTPQEWKNLWEGNKNSLEALRESMLQEIDFFKQISTIELIKVGQDIRFTRKVLIALVRKELEKNRHADPFSEEDFNYALLKVGGSEENYRYLYPYFNKCKVIPLEDIVSLGKGNIIVAEIILNDFSTTPYFFIVSEKLAEFHDKLKKNMAENWAKNLATYPVAPRYQLGVAKSLTALKKYPEFKNVAWNTRLERILFPNRGGNQISSEWENVLLGAGIGSLAYVGWTVAICACTISPFLPLYFMVGGAVAGLVCSSCKPLNDLKNEARKKSFLR